MAEKEYIERNVALSEICAGCGIEFPYEPCEPKDCEIKARLENIPAADVNPVVHSRWEINCDGYYPYCMNCKKEPPGRVMTDFCPNCGADMRGAQTDV